jgi:predicted nucleic acid-binding protein
VSRLLVLDASAAIEAVLGRSQALEIVEHLEHADRVAVPDLYFAEIANALWKYVRNGDLLLEDAQTMLSIATSLPDDVLPARELATEALATATAFDHPVYDALYAVTARREGAAVCTLDQRLARLLEAMRVPTITL